MSEPALPTLRRPSLRTYFYAAAVYLGALVALTYLLWAYDGAWFLLTLSLAYFSLCCTFIPLPTTAIMVWLNVWGVDPLAAATVGACGTMLANLLDYHMIRFFMGYRFVERARRTKLYAVAVRWFDKRPLLTIAVWNFIPFSMDVARWVACLRAYPRGPFMLGAFLGRWPRYVLIGLVTRWWRLSEAFVGFLLLLTAVAGVARALLYLWHFLRQRRKLIRMEQGPSVEGDGIDEGTNAHPDAVRDRLDRAGDSPSPELPAR